MKSFLAGSRRLKSNLGARFRSSRNARSWRGAPWLGLCALFLFTAQTMPASSVVPPTFPELVNESDYVVRAVVQSVTSEWKERQGRKHIVTHVTLNVLEVINGTPPQPLVLEMLGGRVGDEEMVVQGMPQFSVGQEDILFIRGNGRQFYPLTAAMHGRYPVVREKNGAAHVNRSNQQPLQSAAQVVSPMSEEGAVETKEPTKAVQSGLTPENFTQQIKAAVNPDYRRASKQK